MSAECGCEIKHPAPMPHPPSRIIHCPKHAAVDDLLAALECARDYGIFEDNKRLDGIEGIPGGEFNAKWGEIDRAEVVKRVAAALTKAGTP